jgi:autotransporter-associated beta strand protein
VSLIVVVVLVALATLPVAARPAFAASDIGSDIKANRDVILAGDSVVTLSGGTTTYSGVISGEGTLTIAGAGTLVLTKDSDFTIPSARHTESVTTAGGNHPWYSIKDPDPPAVIVNKGVTLQYGAAGGATGFIRHFPYQTDGFSLNGLNIKVDGTLDIAVTQWVHLGIISGSGFILQRRGTWPGLVLAGDHPFSGVLYNGTGMVFASPNYMSHFPNVRKVLNQGSAIMDTAMDQQLVVGMDFYNREWGSDINFHSRGTGLVVMTGVYSWANSGPDTDPTLADPSLNFQAQPHRANKRGINIEGASVQWGDGTGNRFFLPGNKDTLYINMHAARNRSRLAFNYNGPVTLGATISGGKFNDTFTAVGEGDIVIVGTKGNDVTFAAPQNYNGSTTIEADATLRLGSGSPDGDGSLLASAALFKIVNDGMLVVQNSKTDVTLSRMSGSGSLTQAGTATTTLAGDTTYTGVTTILAGTLSVTSGDISTSSEVRLAKAGAKLDLSNAGPQTVRNLSGVADTAVVLGGNQLTVGTGDSTVFAGGVTGEHGVVDKVGTGTLSLSGASTTPGGTWQVREGALQLDAAASVQATLTVASGATLSGGGRVDGQLLNAGTVVPDALRVTAGYTQDAGAALHVSPAHAGGMVVAGPVKLAGALSLAAGAAPGDVQQITLIDNSGPAPVSGTFDGLPEGANLAMAGTTYQISYLGGDGNDVVLTIGQRAGPIGALAGGMGNVLIGIAFLVLLVASVVGFVLLRRRSRRSVESSTIDPAL